MFAEDAPNPPGHLSEEAQRLWRRVAHEYVLETHGYELLTAAFEAWDRARQARQTLDRDGLTVTDRYGQVKPHPCVQIERDSRNQFRQMLRELALDPEPDDTRPPR